MGRDSHDAERRPLARDLQDDHRPPALDLGFNGFEFPEPRLDPEEFDALIEARGVACLLRRSIRCPCLRIESRQARVGCPVCGGLGYAYPLELEQPIVALVLGRNARRRQEPVGQAVSGTCKITFQRGILPAQGDMILPDGEEHAVQQVLRRAQAQVDPQVVRNRQTAPDQLAPLIQATTERLLYPDVTAIETVYWLDDEKLRACVQGADYVRRGNAIEFRADRGPPAGKAFSIRYRAPGAYVIAPGEPVTRTGEEGFPYQCEGQRLDRWGAGDLR